MKHFNIFNCYGVSESREVDRSPKDPSPVSNRVKRFNWNIRICPQELFFLQFFGSRIILLCTTILPQKKRYVWALTVLYFKMIVKRKISVFCNFQSTCWIIPYWTIYIKNNVRSKKYFGWEKNWREKKTMSKKIGVKQIFWSEKKIESKKNLSLKKIFGW